METPNTSTHIIYCTRFSDDMVVLASGNKELQRIKTKFYKCIVEYEMKINVGKTVI